MSPTAEVSAIFTSIVTVLGAASMVHGLCVGICMHNVSTYQHNTTVIVVLRLAVGWYHTAA